MFSRDDSVALPGFKWIIKTSWYNNGQQPLSLSKDFKVHFSCEIILVLRGDIIP